MNDDQLASITDVSFFASAFNSIGPNLPYTVRLDFNMDGKITITDVSYFAVAFNSRCSP